jgi:hypothetical protein
MTAIKEVTRNQMIRETGLDTLGYSQPENKLILIQKGLDEDTRKEVLAHEYDHAQKGEEGPFLGAVIGGIASGLLASSGAKSASKAQAKAADKAAQVQWDMYDQTRTDQAPWRYTGQAALSQLASLYGLPYMPLEGMGGEAAKTTQTRTTERIPKPPGYDTWAEIDPNYARLNPLTRTVTTDTSTAATPSTTGWQPTGMQGFYDSPEYILARRGMDEDIRTIDRSAAARGRLNSGAQLRELERYRAGLADKTYGTYANRLGSMAGVGQVATNQLAKLGQGYAANIGNAYQNAGDARASGYINQTNAWEKAAPQIGYGVYNMLNPVSTGYSTTPTSLYDTGGGFMVNL